MDEKHERKSFHVATKVNEMYSEYCAGNLSQEELKSSPAYWEWEHLKETMAIKPVHDPDPLMDLYINLLVKNLMILEEQIFPSKHKDKVK